MKRTTYLPCGLALMLCIVSRDASAWGLGTHVYFAESLLTLPIAGPVLLTAMRRFPSFVLAGACLPDLALFGKLCGTTAFASNHQWATAYRLLNSAESDEERAAAIGYSSHLFIDVIAHNHFVPSHEQRWLNVPNLTHAAAEWAMDVHLSDRIQVWPAEVLRADQRVLAEYVADSFGCPSNAAEKTLRMLIRSEALLRSTRLPEICYRLARTLDNGTMERFDQYAATTANALPQIERVLAGTAPDWHPEGTERPIPLLRDLVMFADSRV